MIVRRAAAPAFEPGCPRQRQVHIETAGNAMHFSRDGAESRHGRGTGRKAIVENVQDRTSPKA